MVYILETEVLENKSVYFSLTKVFGMNNFQSFLVCKKLGLAYNCKLNKLTPDQIVNLIKFIENSNLLITNNLKKSKILIAKKLVQIKAYKGIRKLRGLPVRGQRTHTNGKTASKFN
jgi:small subunit ribosomal protein S13